MTDNLTPQDETCKPKIYEIEKEILEIDKPNIWNVWQDNNMERILEVDFQKFGIAVTELSGQSLTDITTFTFYATVEHLKEKHQQMLLEEEIKHLHLLDDEYQKLYRWNHDTSNHLLALSLLIEQKKYDQALSYIHTLNTSREETKL